jgi:DNA-binding PadR family transcriptional regulator
MIVKVRIGSLVKFYTILLISEGPKHGYDLMKELEEKPGRKISPSQVYPFLSILEKNNLIKVSTIKEREKKMYVLTKEGKKFVNGILHRFGDLLHIAIEPKLTVCAHCGCKVYEGGHKEKIGKKQLTFCCHHCAMAFKKEME